MLSLTTLNKHSRSPVVEIAVIWPVIFFCGKGEGGEESEQRRQFSVEEEQSQEAAGKHTYTSVRMHTSASTQVEIFSSPSSRCCCLQRRRWERGRWIQHPDCSGGEQREGSTCFNYPAQTTWTTCWPLSAAHRILAQFLLCLPASRCPSALKSTLFTPM